MTVKYKIVLSGNIVPEKNRDDVLHGLAVLFHSSPGAMEKLLQGRRTPLKKEYNRQQADTICRKLENVGAQCEIEKIEQAEPEMVQDVQDEMPDSGGPEGDSGDGTDVHAAAGGNAGDTAAVDMDAQNQGRPEPAPQAADQKHSADSLLMKFVGENAEYYLHQFEKFGGIENPTYRFSWHWPAFFSFFFWALYRKMWIIAAIYLALGFGLALIGSPTPVVLAWLLSWPCCANYIYFRKAAACVDNAMRHPQRQQSYLQRGGVSKSAVWVGAGIFIVFFVMASNYFTRQFLQEHGADIKDVLPGSGTQMRRDGGIIEHTPDGRTALAKTSLRLSYLATSLRLLIAAKAGEPNSAKTAEYIRTLNSGKIKDGWGNPIRIMEELDRYVIYSAGQDSAFDTADDILQFVKRR